MTTYELSAAAYTLPLLHAAAHPSASVHGLLLGRASGAQIAIEDAIPLVHRYPSLSPATELGADLARAWGQPKGLEVVGVYVAREGAETDLGRIGDKILEALRREFPQAIGLVLDNSKLASSEPIYTPYSAAGSVVFPGPSVCAGALKLVRQDGVHRSLRDLDDYLDDSSNDFLNNPEAHAAVAKLS